MEVRSDGWQGRDQINQEQGQTVDRPESGHVRDGMILSAAVMISRLLGLIYIIPLYHIVGTEGIFITMVGYIPYTVILTLTTLGLPLAFSKYVAKYNALGDYRRGKSLLRSSFYLMLLLGSVSFVLSFFLAPFIVNWLQAPEALWTIRSVCAALIIVPAMALLRGYFQGWNSMGPTAVSQVIEQLVRVLFFLFAAWLMVSTGFTMETTIAVASLGTLVGAASGLAVLLFYWYKRRKGIHEKVLASPPAELDSKLRLYHELLRNALPISLVTLAIPLFMFIDMLLFQPLLYWLGYTVEQAKTAFSILTGTAHKVMMIPVSVATAFSLAILPSVTAAHERKEREKVQVATEQGVLFLLYLMLPASIGLLMLATPIHMALFGDTSGVVMLKWYASSTVFIALFTVTSSMLQGIGALRRSVLNLVVALGVKTLSMPVLLDSLGENGAILATTLGFLAGSLGNILVIHTRVGWSGLQTIQHLVKIVCSSVLMGVFVLIYVQVWDNLVAVTRGSSMFQFILGCGVGAAFYFVLTRKLPGAQYLIRLLKSGDKAKT